MKNWLILIFLQAVGIAAHAQCAMCKAVVESDQSGAAAGINNGIIYLMGIPYLLMGVVGYAVYRHYKKNKEAA